MCMSAEGYDSSLAHGRPKTKSSHYGLAWPESTMTRGGGGGVRSNTRLDFNQTEPFSSSCRTSSISSLLLRCRCIGDLCQLVVRASPCGVMIPTTHLDLASLCLWPSVLSHGGAGFNPSSSGSRRRLAGVARVLFVLCDVPRLSKDG
jgi:hypothetical protein